MPKRASAATGGKGAGGGNTARGFLQQAEELAGKHGIYILVSGNPEVSTDVVVTAQSIPKEKNVPVGSTIRLEFTDTKAAD